MKLCVYRKKKLKITLRQPHRPGFAVVVNACSFTQFIYLDRSSKIKRLRQKKNRIFFV